MKNGLITHSDGDQYWYKDSKIHREDDLPAVILSDGSQFWYINGEWHRENGPSNVWPHGVEWWLNDVYYSFDDWCIKLDKSPKEKAYLMLKYME